MCGATQVPQVLTAMWARLAPQVHREPQEQRPLSRGRRASLEPWEPPRPLRARLALQAMWATQALRAKWAMQVLLVCRAMQARTAMWVPQALKVMPVLLVCRAMRARTAT